MVYQVAWSADSRLLVSSSKDSTLKVWKVEARELMLDLPGHADEVCFDTVSSTFSVFLCFKIILFSAVI